uniref:Uncharacterized protein n=1 Tax=Oryza glumipatula TaxID=40148 RepID=A0A0E0B9P1_9ORYZ
MELLRSIGYYVPLPQMGPLGMPVEYAVVGFHLGEFRMPPLPQTRTAGAGGSSRVFGACSAGLQESVVGQVVVPVRGPEAGGKRHG